MINTINTEFSSAEVQFTDQSSKALEIEDNGNLLDKYLLLTIIG